MAKSFDRIKRNVMYILEKIKKVHPSQHARDEATIRELTSIVDSMIENNFSENEIGEILEMIKAVSIQLFNAVIGKSKYSVKCRQIYSKYSWNKRMGKLRG